MPEDREVAAGEGAVVHEDGSPDSKAGSVRDFVIPEKEL
jgi:hypothetical protein